MSFLSIDQLHQIGFKSFGTNVFISDRCSIYNPQNISIGNNVRIDDFCILSASKEINIGNYVHIACYSSLIGEECINLEDFVSISSRVSIYSSTDDYLGLGMTNPMVPAKLRRVTHGSVTLEKHVIIGAGSVVMPGINLAQGVAVSALSLVLRNCEAFTVYRGTPAIEIGKRNRRILELEKKMNYE